MNKIKKAIFMLIGAMWISVLFAGNVWQDCVGWYQGAEDANGDGYFQSGEWCDLRHAAYMSDSAYRAVPAQNNGQIKIQSVDVDVASLGRTLKNQSCLYFSAPDDPSVTVFDTVKIPARATATTDQYTILMRFKRDATSHAGNVLDWLVNLGNNYSGKQGLVIGVDPSAKLVTTFGSLGSYDVKLPLDWEGTSPHPPRSAHPERSCWHELAIVVNGRTVRYGLLQPGVAGDANWGTTAKWKTFDLRDPAWEAHITSFVPASQYRIGNESNGKQTAFKGYVHMFACWNRVLSDAEVYEAFGMPQPSLIRMGSEGTGADSFTGVRAASSVINADSIVGQKDMPREILSGDSITINFEVNSYFVNLPQLLKIEASSASATGVFDVTVGGSSIGAIKVVAGKVNGLYVPAACFGTIGMDSLVLKRTDGGVDPIKLDYIELGGSKLFGLVDNGVTADTSSEGSDCSPNDFYAYDGNLRNLRWATNGSSKRIRLNFWVDDYESENCPLVYEAKMMNPGDDSSNFDHYLTLNGVEGYRSKGVASSVKVKFNRGSLKPGNNVLEWRFADGTTGKSWLQFDYQRLTIGKPGQGMLLIFR